MGILLYHENDGHGPVYVSEGKVAGEHYRARRYEHQGNFLHVEGADHVVEHDAAEIQRMPGYRLATADEQEHFFKAKQKASRLHERKG